MKKLAFASKVIAPVALVVSSFAYFGTSVSSGTAPPQFGTLSNFDVFNDTGEVTHGFEIELDGINPSDVTYQFGAPYERYGNPTVTAFSGGTLVTYASSYDASHATWAAGTPLAPAVITPTMGHDCWTGGSASYPTAGCEHFGLGLIANPTNVVYNWLVASKTSPGSLEHASGGGVAIAAPQWNVQPAPAPAVNPKPVIKAVLPAPQEPGDPQLGEATWVKVYVTETPSKSDLGHLLTGDNQVPKQVETEWAILQGGNGGGVANELSDDVQLKASDNSISRRYEFYAYSGAYDPENHEALPVNDSRPVKSDIGALIGNQMVALNLAGGPKADTTPPTAQFSFKAPATTKAKTMKLTFTAKDPDSKVFTFYCAIDGAIPSVCTSGKTLTNLKVGVHTVRLYAADAARNASKAALIRWTVLK